MYEFIVAACVMFNGGGDPVNPCFVDKAQGSYQTYDQCKYSANRRKDEVYTALQNKHPKAGIVVMAPCGK